MPFAQRSHVRHFRIVVAAAWIAAAHAFTSAAAPPAPSEPVSETLHGVRVVDPYRNLEDLKSPSTRAWLKAKGEEAAALLARIDGRDSLARRIAELSAAGGDQVRGIVRLADGRAFYLRRGAGESQFKLVVRNSAGGTERVLVDPEALARSSGVPHAINYFRPSWDGTMVAYGVSEGGSEKASLHVVETESGREIGRPIARVLQGTVQWTPDSRRLAFNQVRALAPGTADTETYLDSTTFLLDPRNAGAKATALFGPLVNKSLGLARLDVPQVIFAADSRYMVARTTDTTVPEGRLYVAPVAALAAPHPAEIAWRQIASASDRIYGVALRGDTLYLLSHAGAPRGRVLALSLQKPILGEAVEVVAQPATAAIVAVGVGRDALFTEQHRGFSSRVVRHGGARGAGSDAAPRQPGSTSLTEDAGHAHDDAWLVTSSWTEPARVIAAASDGATRDTGVLDAARPAGAQDIEATEVMVPSDGGVAVPLAILRRKGLVLDGSAPTLLVGYGAYGLSYRTFFDPRRIAWLERGGVLAYANVRGGGAFGDAWHRAGFKATKPNTWKDGIACARYLIAERYASPRTLAVSGGSAGGIFAGRALTSAPELFAAAVLDVGNLDTLRSEESANGITNVSEFGSVRNADEFPALLEMSTYQHIRERTAYPAVLLIHGLNDPRVDVWHSAKTAARLQAATTSGKPILLRLDAQAGHGIGSTAQQGFAKLADIYSFLLWQFGRAALEP